MSVQPRTNSDVPNVLRSGFKRLLYRIAHRVSYRLNNRRETTVARAAGFRLVVPPTVFHPRHCLTGEFFAKFVARLDLTGKRVADLGTGTGILALAAARAGAASVVALDINPNAARAAAENARMNGLEHRVGAMCSDLLSAITPRPLFDVILSNMPVLPVEPVDVIDRCWFAGPDYRDIASLYEQVRERLSADGRMYTVMPSGADLRAITRLFERAGFRGRAVDERSQLIESVFIYELRRE
jgi:release factor glutamine methyltransferase